MNSLLPGKNPHGCEQISRALVQCAGQVPEVWGAYWANIFWLIIKKRAVCNKEWIIMLEYSAYLVELHMAFWTNFQGISSVCSHRHDIGQAPEPAVCGAKWAHAFWLYTAHFYHRWSRESTFCPGAFTMQCPLPPKSCHRKSTKKLIIDPFWSILDRFDPILSWGLETTFCPGAFTMPPCYRKSNKKLIFDPVWSIFRQIWSNMSWSLEITFCPQAFTMKYPLPSKSCDRDYGSINKQKILQTYVSTNKQKH